MEVEGLAFNVSVMFYCAGRGLACLASCLLSISFMSCSETGRFIELFIPIFGVRPRKHCLCVPSRGSRLGVLLRNRTTLCSDVSFILGDFLYVIFKKLDKNFCQTIALTLF